MQHIATLLGATCCVRLATMLRFVATCWVLLAQVWKWQNLSQQHPTRRNMSQQGGQTHATSCSQQCCDMLRWHVAIVWPGLKTKIPQKPTGPTHPPPHPAGYAAQHSYVYNIYWGHNSAPYMTYYRRSLRPLVKENEDAWRAPLLTPADLLQLPSAVLQIFADQGVEASYSEVLAFVGIWSRECERSSPISSGRLLWKGLSVSVIDPRRFFAGTWSKVTDQLIQLMLCYLCCFSQRLNYTGTLTVKLTCLIVIFCPRKNG